MSNTYTDLLLALEEGTLQPKNFTHAAHIGVAVAALQRYPFFDAMKVVADGLYSMASRAGVPEKFNATLTLASMSLIAEWLAQDDTCDPEQFIARHGDALRVDKLRALYSPGRLETPLARQTGLLPWPTAPRQA